MAYSFVTATVFLILTFGSMMNYIISLIGSIAYGETSKLEAESSGRFPDSFGYNSLHPICMYYRGLTSVASS